MAVEGGEGTEMWLSIGPEVQLPVQLQQACGTPHGTPVHMGPPGPLAHWPAHSLW